MKENWRIWDNDKQYGDLFYKRAIGELPEMESSKALAKLASTFICENDKILDVGCGAGHYLRSLDKHIDVNFSYVGIDQTEYYIEKAKRRKDRSRGQVFILDSFMRFGKNKDPVLF